MSEDKERRDFLKAATAAFTTQIFTGNLKGANDKYHTAVIGMGRMGRSNLGLAMKQDNVAVTHVCDVYKPHLEQAVDMTQGKAKGVRDFREILADKSVDIVCISTPDHWHPYMTVEACKAGKDVYVEKPICVVVEEGRKMVEAARKYKRVVQAGTMQRSGTHFQQATDMVRSGKLGKVTMVHTWNIGLTAEEGIGNPPDTDPPAGLDWDMWLGPAPKRPFNANRFGVDPNAFSHFRWFWDYAGGMMTDWGVHWLDIVQMAFSEATPTAINCVAGKFRLKDNRETPDTIHASYEYPGFCATYENRYGNEQSMFGKNGGILFHGDLGTLFVDRSEYRVIPEKRSELREEVVKSSNNANMAHWQNFLECVRTRQTPISDIEKCFKSTSTCLLANVALRSKLRLDWDGETVKQHEARKYLTREYRKPWKLTV
ncbi:MAG TPA: Gfo/Idh/MocA family oxidoreductase [Bryobacteraceae bacterium]|nr:Gfo/Idh/MocA family oxidoreductase [Bryobacteraceae bacterium]